MKLKTSNNGVFEKDLETLQRRFYEVENYIAELNTICRILKVYVNKYYRELIPIFDYMDIKFEKINNIFK